MLKKIHGKDWQKRKKRLIIIMAALILPGFLFFGIYSSFRSLSRQTENAYGWLFGKPIKEEDYVAAAKAIDIQLKVSLGEAFYQLQKFFPRDELVRQRLVMLNEIKKRKIRVSDKEVIDQIQKDPSFYRKGVFDKELYEQIIRYGLGISARNYEEITRQNLAIRKLFEEVTKSVLVSDEDLKEIYQKENQQFSVTYIAAIPESFINSLEPTEEQLRQYFEEHAGEFQTKERFVLEYVKLENKDQIPDLTQRLSNKQTFEKICQDYNLTAMTTEPFSLNESNIIPSIGLSKELSDMIKQSNPKTVLPVVEVDKKFYLVRIKDRYPPGLANFETAREEVKTKFIKEKSRQLAKEKIEACAAKLKEKNVSNREDFINVAKEFGLKTQNTSLFGYNSYIEGVGLSNAFFNEASSLKDNQISQVIEMPSGFYLIMVKERPVFDQQKFTQEKEQLRQKVLTERKQEYFDNFIKDLMKKAEVKNK
ncbi:MAG: peptidyl-prolyl cis-trans isomerase [Candidatus Omnitrophica bacterium]|nr:peptidyl-prolyl cis-trans isomerase [Candidatus Omnitrophota bacterium]